MTCRVTFSLRGVWNIDACLSSRRGGAFGEEELLSATAPKDAKDSRYQKKKKGKENQYKGQAAVRDHRPTV